MTMRYCPCAEKEVPEIIYWQNRFDDALDELNNPCTVGAYEFSPSLAFKTHEIENMEVAG